MDGQMIFVLGEGGSGKTTLSFDMLDEARPKGLPKAVIMAPDLTNPRMFDLDRTTDSPEDLKELEATLGEARGDLLVLIKQDNPEIFTELSRMKDHETPVYPIIIGDDMGALLGETEMNRAFKSFVRGIRWRHQTFIISTHRIVDDLPNNAHMVTKWILWVGRMQDTKEADNIYNKGNIKGEISREEFYKKLDSLPSYDWQKKNKDAIFAVKHP